MFHLLGGMNSLSLKQRDYCDYLLYNIVFFYEFCVAHVCSCCGLIKKLSLLSVIIATTLSAVIFIPLVLLVGGQIVPKIRHIIAHNNAKWRGS